MSTQSGPNILHYLGVFFVIIAVVVMGAWGAMGAHMITQYEVATTVVKTDEFGDEVERTVMEEQFQFGLLPDKGYDAAAPLAGFFGVLGIVLLVVARRKKKGADAPSQESGADGAVDGEPKTQ